LVRESTKKPGQIYDVVEVDILPESSTEFLPDANWNVEIIKDDQVSRFYYKVTYKTLE
jgi:hypothetical protein